MNYKNNSVKNLHSPTFYPQSPQNYFQKPSFSNHFIDNTTVSIDDDYELEVETIISNLNKLSFHLHMVSQITMDRLEQTVVGFYNQCMLPFKTQLRKQPSTPQLHQFQHFPAKQKKLSSFTSLQQPKPSQLQAQMLKIQKLKRELKEDKIKNENILELKSIQQKYINKNKVAEIYFYLNKLLKEMLKSVEKAETVKGMIPHVRDVYEQVWKMNKEKGRMCEVLEEYLREGERLMEDGQGEEGLG